MRTSTSRSGLDQEDDPTGEVLDAATLLGLCNHDNLDSDAEPQFSPGTAFSP